MNSLLQNQGQVKFDIETAVGNAALKAKPCDQQGLLERMIGKFPIDLPPNPLAGDRRLEACGTSACGTSACGTDDLWAATYYKSMSGLMRDQIVELVIENVQLKARVAELEGN